MDTKIKKQQIIEMINAMHDADFEKVYTILHNPYAIKQFIDDQTSAVAMLSMAIMMGHAMKGDGKKDKAIHASVGETFMDAIKDMIDSATKISKLS